MKYVAKDVIYLTHYQQCTRCTWSIIIKNAPVTWIREKDISYGLDRRYELDKPVVEKEIENFNFNFDIRGGCTHGRKIRKSKKRKEPTPTPRPEPQIIIENFENLSDYLSTEDGKQHMEYAEIELEKLDSQELFL